MRRGHVVKVTASPVQSMNAALVAADCRGASKDAVQVNASTDEAVNAYRMNAHFGCLIFLLARFSPDTIGAQNDQPLRAGYERVISTCYQLAGNVSDFLEKSLATKDSTV